jgi:hypothetical protein
MLECPDCKIPFEVVRIHRRHQTAFKNMNAAVKWCPFCGRQLTKQFKRTEQPSQSDQSLESAA